MVKERSNKAKYPFEIAIRRFRCCAGQIVSLLESKRRAIRSVSLDSLVRSRQKNKKRERERERNDRKTKKKKTRAHLQLRTALITRAKTLQISEIERRYAEKAKERRRRGRGPETRAKEAASPLPAVIVAVINRILLRKEKQLPEIRLG